jgi:hypothetical protein
MKYLQRAETSSPKRLPKSHSDRSSEKKADRTQVRTVQGSEGIRARQVLRLVRKTAAKGQPTRKPGPQATKSASR